MKKAFSLLLLMGLVLSASAQHKRNRGHDNGFDFSLNGALNMCQIDGDQSGNYNKLGYRFGVNTSFPLGEGGFRMLVEIGVSEKGSLVSRRNASFSALYIEVPLLLAYDVGVGGSGALRLGAGVAPAILGKATVVEAGVRNQVQENNFRSLDALPLCLEAQYRFNDHFGIEARYYNSLLPVTKEASSGTYRLFRSNQGVFHRLISVGASYRF